MRGTMVDDTLHNLATQAAKPDTEYFERALSDFIRRHYEMLGIRPDGRISRSVESLVRAFDMTRYDYHHERLSREMLRAWEQIQAETR